MNDLKLARALGWASLTIAAVEILGQGKVERDLVGSEEHPVLMRALGVREAAAGATILSQKAITPTLATGLWSRVVGDAMDLVLLGGAGTRTNKPASWTVSTLLLVGITALDVLCATRVQKKLGRQSQDRTTVKPPSPRATPSDNEFASGVI